jgi:hypothetical protein
MYLARFSYDVLPVNRQRAIEFIHNELDAARANGLNARLLVPLTRGAGGAALQFEVDLTQLDQLDQFRHRGVAARSKPVTGCTSSARSWSPRRWSRSCASISPRLRSVPLWRAARSWL